MSLYVDLIIQYWRLSFSRCCRRPASIGCSSMSQPSALIIIVIVGLGVLIGRRHHRKIDDFEVIV
jgi:hypothetical protein